MGAHSCLSLAPCLDPFSATARPEGAWCRLWLCGSVEPLGDALGSQAWLWSPHQVTQLSRGREPLGARPGHEIVDFPSRTRGWAAPIYGRAALASRALAATLSCFGATGVKFFAP